MQLLIEDDEGSRSVVPYLPDEVTIGRESDNQIELGERNVSRHHARLVRTNGRLFVEDVEARYGIYKNGQPIDERTEFNEGDRVRVGDYQLTLRPETGTEAPSPEEVEGANKTEIDASLETPSGEPTPSVSAPDSDTGRGGPTDPPAELVVTSGKLAGREFTLDRGELVAGRAPESDIQIDHRSVSSKHAKFVCEPDGSYKVVDLNSKNGVQVDGEQYKTVTLEDGDEVELGHVELRFVAPGEDFIFDPGAEPEATEPAASGWSTGPAVLAGGAVGLVVVALGGFMLFGSGNTDEESGSSEASEPEQPAAAAGDDEQDRSEKKVRENIEQAKEDIQNGNLDKAIGALESLSDLLDPTQSQSQTISELLSEARSERPFKRRFDAAKSALEDGDNKTALQKLDEIPEHSVFYQLARDQKMFVETLDGLLDRARDELSDGDTEVAAKIAEVVKTYEVREDRAETLLSEIEEATAPEEDPRREEAEQLAQREQTAPETTDSEEDEPAGGGGAPAEESGQSGAGSGASGGSSGGSSGESSSEPSSESSGGAPPAPDDPKAVFRKATKMYIQGKNRAAISECERALRAGHRPCYRVIGMANKKLGNQTAACENFETYLESDPSDASRIRSAMDELGCE